MNRKFENKKKHLTLNAYKKKRVVIFFLRSTEGSKEYGLKSR
jgi:hypothetical protein